MTKASLKYVFLINSDKMVLFSSFYKKYTMFYLFMKFRSNVALTLNKSKAKQNNKGNKRFCVFSYLCFTPGQLSPDIFILQNAYMGTVITKGIPNFQTKNNMHPVDVP
jgi:hypothetical protein